MNNDTNAILAFERIKWAIEDLGGLEVRKIFKRFADVKGSHDPVPLSKDTLMTASLQQNVLALNRAEAWDIARYLEKDDDGNTKFNQILFGSKVGMSGAVEDIVMKVDLNITKDGKGELKIEEVQGNLHLDTSPKYILTFMSPNEIFEEVCKDFKDYRFKYPDQGFTSLNKLLQCQINIEKEMEDAKIDDDLSTLINETSLKLTKEGKASWNFINEGNNNILMQFKLIDTDIDSCKFLLDKVLRVKKTIPENFVNTDVIGDFNEYENYIFKYIVNGDSQFDPFIPKSYQVELSTEFLNSIEDTIEQGRKIRQEDNSKSVETVKRFLPIDYNNRIGTLIDNLSSNYQSLKGIPKHAEMKIGLAMKKKIPRDVYTKLNEKYSQKQIDSIGDLEAVSKYNDELLYDVQDVVDLIEGRVPSLLPYNPYNFMSKDLSLIRKAVYEIFNSNNPKTTFHVRGEICTPSDEDIDFIAETLMNTGILDLIGKYQICDWDPYNEHNAKGKCICEVTEIYTNLTKNQEVDHCKLNSLNDHYKYIVTAFETFHKRKAGICEINDDIQTQWNYVVDMVIAETFRHSTFMLSYEEFEEEEEDGIKQMKLNQISFIDLDTRKITGYI